MNEELQTKWDGSMEGQAISKRQPWDQILSVIVIVIVIVQSEIFL